LGKRNLADIVFLLVLAAALFVPMLRIDTQSVKSARENRTLAAFPPLFENGGINDSFGASFDEWFGDRFFGREFVIQGYDDLKFKVNKKISGNFAIDGGGWIFTTSDNSVRNYQNLDLFSEEELARIAGFLSRMDDWCRANGKRFYYVIAPDKNKVYGEFFPGYIAKVNPDSASRANQLVRHLRENTRVDAFYLYDDLMEHKKDGLLYYRDDTHWNALGAYFGYLAIVGRIARDFPDVVPVRARGMRMESVPEGEAGDLVNAAAGIKTAGEGYVRPVVEENFDCNTGDRSGRHIDVHCTNERGRRGIAVFRDSFSNALVPYLGATFARADLYRYDRDRMTPAVLAEVKSGADIVVLEQVERLLPDLLKMKFWAED
jgi:hypothetical protein